MTSLFRKGDEDKDEAAPDHPAAEHAEGEGGQGAVREFLERSQHTIDEWQRRVDDRFRHLLETISPFAATEKEVARLKERVEELEREVRALRDTRGDL